MSRVAAAVALAFLIACSPAFAQSSISLRGRVLDAATREPIAKALVSIRSLQLEATTDRAGEFVLTGLAPGRIELYVSTVGYALLKREMNLSNAADTPVEILLGAEELNRSESVDVV